ncbi:MAG: hypothetical protein ACRC67_40965 [Inquilinus sp.]|uniref:hypothetical protein n=1 Tax=Inquilinus sp. TaxID=1932117 RepID=UPI003F41380F
MITRRGLFTRTLAGTAGLAALTLAGRRGRAEEPRIRMFQLYGRDMSFSLKAQTLAGTRVSIQGFMAPHLKVDSDFFILSNAPVETCPFCASEGDWIDSIVFVRMREREEAVDPGALIVAAGTLEIGPATDAATGFVSRVRLVDATFELS